MKQLNKIKKLIHQISRLWRKTWAIVDLEKFLWRASI